MWLAYPTVVLALLAFVFMLFVRWTLKAHPVPELNYAYEPRYARHYSTAPDWQSIGFQAAFAASASSAVGVVPVDPRLRIAHARRLEQALWR